VLVVLDNLEHLIAEDEDDRCGADWRAFAHRLRLKVLATSRQALRLQEEWLYGLDGLALRAASASGDAQSYPAVQFFAQRARQATWVSPCRRSCPT
jgi:predicted ATPase